MYSWNGESNEGLLGETAKHIAHQTEQLQRAGVSDPVIHAIGVLACTQYPFVTQYREML